MLNIKSKVRETWNPCNLWGLTQLLTLLLRSRWSYTILKIFYETPQSWSEDFLTARTLSNWSLFNRFALYFESFTILLLRQTESLWPPHVLSHLWGPAICLLPLAEVRKSIPVSSWSPVHRRVDSLAIGGRHLSPLQQLTSVLQCSALQYYYIKQK